MATPTETESDPLFKLLTDALRAGPGSPQWRQALTELRQSNHPGADDYQTLLDARERLESGKQYRSVRAGPGFTRNLLNGIESESAAPPRRSTFSISLVVLCACVVAIGAIVAAIIYLSRAQPTAPPPQTVADLQNANFLTTVDTATFDKVIPAQWKFIGALTVKPDKGLRPGPGASAGGGAYFTRSLADIEPFEFEATLQCARSSSQITAEVFVSDSDQFNDRQGTASDELAWLLSGDKQQVRVNGVQAETTEQSTAFPTTLNVRIIVGKSLAIVKVNGQTLWSGPHGLGGAARYVGVRFIRAGDNSAGTQAFTSARVLRK